MSVEISLRAATEPITLNKCLEQFTKQEELGDDEKYYCSNCKSHQLASKKLQIWRLPAVLVSNETVLAIHCKMKFYLNYHLLLSAGYISLMVTLICRLFILNVSIFSMGGG